MLSLFTFRHQARDERETDDHNLALVNAINDDGRIYLTQTRVDGRVADPLPGRSVRDDKGRCRHGIRGDHGNRGEAVSPANQLPSATPCPSVGASFSSSPCGSEIRSTETTLSPSAVSKIVTPFDVATCNSYLVDGNADNLAAIGDEHDLVIVGHRERGDLLADFGNARNVGRANALSATVGKAKIVRR